MRRCAVAAFLLCLAGVSATTDCDCCARNATAAECPPGSDVTARPDCPCCAVCAASHGEACHPRSVPCGEGLDCVEGICSDQQTCRSDNECAKDRFCLGRVCFDPCTILDPCKNSLKNGICRTRQHRPVCSCPDHFVFDPANKACVRRECQTAAGSIDVGKKVHINQCQESCICGAGGEFNCSQTVCPPGSYLPGTFADDELCVEFQASDSDGECCVHVFCSNIPPELPTETPTVTSTTTEDISIITESPSTSTSTNSPSPSSATTTTGTPSSSHVPSMSPEATEPSPLPLLDLILVSVSHNSTVLQLPSISGILSYSSDVSPLMEVPLDESNVQTVTGLLPDSEYVFTWSGTGGQATLAVRTLSGCVVGAGRSHALGDTYHMGCDSTCVCAGSNQPTCRPRCHLVRGSAQSGNTQCTELPDADDPDCCVRLECAVTTPLPEQQIGETSPASIYDVSSTTEAASSVPTPVDDATGSSDVATTSSSTTSSSTTTTTLSSTGAEKRLLDDSEREPLQPQPTLLVTTKAFNSVTLAWDDFKPQTYEHGYVAEFRDLNDAGAGGEQPWQREVIPPQTDKSVPLLQIADLLPSTEYEVRVSIYRDKQLDLLGDSTETIRFTTADGCYSDNNTYPVGEQFNRGCEETCFCKLRGNISCSPRCQRPFFRSGAFKDDPLCFEKEMDECCVVVACASSAENEDTELSDDPCVTASCDENYVCEVMSKEAEDGAVQSAPMCVCPTGFHEVQEAEVRQCLDDSSTVDPVVEHSGCMYNQQTYMPGDEFNKGCDYSCVCNEDEEIECKPRCPLMDKDLQNNCQLIPDPEDECCMLHVCDNSTELDFFEALPTDIHEVITACSYGGSVYQFDQEFYEGCEAKCTCLSTGQVACQPRCTLEDTEASDPSCESLPDPQDSCCRIWQCSPNSSSAPSPPAAVPLQPRGSRVDTAGEPLTVIGLDSLNATSSRLRLRVTRAVLDALLSELRGPPLQAQWHYGDAAVQGDTGNQRNHRWNTRDFHADQVSVLDVDMLMIAVTGLTDPQSAWVRVVYGDETSRTVYGRDVMAPQSRPIERAPSTVAVTFATSTSTPAASDLASTVEPADLCGLEAFACGNGICIPRWQVCDFIYDCDDESDEIDCDSKSPSTRTGTTPSDAALEPTTQKPVPTTRRITGLITAVPTAASSDSGSSSAAGAGSTRAPPRPNRLQPSVGIVQVEKKPTEIRVVTVATSASVRAEVVPVINETQKQGELKNISSLDNDRGSFFARLQDPEPTSSLPPSSTTSAPSPLLFPTSPEEISTDSPPPPVAVSQTASVALPAGSSSCRHKGRSYPLAEEFHDGCEQFCICTRGGPMCAPVQCPHDFGKDLINPDCLQWKPDPTFQAMPPSCCPKMVCVNDGSCLYEGQRLRHFDEVPEELSGCDQRCYCEFGNITCQSVCEPLSAVPPASLGCAIQHAELASDGCCKYWQCAQQDGTDNPFPEVPTNVHSLDITGDVEGLEAEVVDSDMVKFSFQVPPHIVGLPGETEILFTEDASLDTFLWSRRVFQDSNHLINSVDLDYMVTGLSANTSYQAVVRVHMQLTGSLLTSEPVSFQTPPLPQAGTTLPPKVAVDTGLEATQINTTSAQVRWRRLGEDELNYVDGIQLRYRDLDVNAQVWTMTPFIHRELTYYRLNGLKPGTSYEVDIVLMPFQNKRTEMVSTQPLRIKTLPIIDMYDFNITLTLKDRSPSSVRVAWSGIPQPQYKFVNVYRIVYIDEKQREEQHTFKLAKTSDDPSIQLKGLKPSSKYQVWLEAYLKNGKKRVSEVQEFDTKPGHIVKAQSIRGDHGDGSSGDGSSVRSSTISYFGSMVAAAAVAALFVLVSLVLIVLLVKKTNSKKAPITSRKSGPSYENPAFKSSDLDINGANGNERFS